MTQPGRRLAGLQALGLVGLAAVAFLPGLWSPFILLDDPLYVLHNTRLHTPGWEGLALMWNSADAYRGAFIEFFPLRDTIYWLLFHAFGPTPFPFHLASLALHAVATLLVWRLVRSWVTPEAAWLAAALFAVHPIHVESVTWAAGLKDPLHLCLMLGSLLCFQAFRLRGARLAYAASLGLLVLALLCKSLPVVTPLLMLALDRFQPPQRSWRESIARVAPHGLVSGLFLVQFVLIARAANVLVPPHGGGWTSHVVLALWAQVRYAQQALLPLSSRLMYCFEPPTGWTDARLWAGVALLTLAGVCFARWSARPLWRLLLSWHVICLLPVANLVPFPAVIADRYLYGPSVAACVLLALVLTQLPGERLRRLVGGGLVLLFLAGTLVRAYSWTNQESLFAEADEDPACMVDPSAYAAKAHFQRATVAQDTEVALDAFQRAFDSAGVQAMARSQVCGILIQALNRAVTTDPTSQTEAWADKVPEVCPNVGTAWYLAAIINLSRHPDRALIQAERARQLAPGPETSMLVALAHLERGDDFDADMQRAREQGRAGCVVLRTWSRRASPQSQEMAAAHLTACQAQ